ncbi:MULTISPECIES: hypothetical protein [Hymenobacter]|uniref:Carboxypeptidase regulatory-like domain-containing protein n=1 Tax=Hymenobacter armeniacus TaxID=2771358 RepID=A0ABR8JZV2_9BACT|nr:MULTISPECIES: hypothetical protein [Hymenobacter]MBD2724202.1 hypothetical protein [Hymenobacter armeniacus]MBJ6110042.1 hypothetical protein [Hymenobacter sp. BT523]
MKFLSNLRPAQFATQVSAAAQGARPVLLGAMVLFGLARPAHAQTLAQEPVQVSQPDSESLRVRINNPALKTIVLRVVHLDNGRWVLNESHRVPAYGTRLRFNDLPTGRYAVMMQVGPERYRYTVDVDGKTPGASTIAVRELTTRRVENVVASAGM